MMKRVAILFGLVLFNVAMVQAADVVVKSTTNRGEINIGDYWIAEDFADGFRKLGQQTEVDYRGEYHRVHTPEPALNLYMRGYTKFVSPFPQGKNVLYVYYPMWYSKASAHRVSKARLNAREKMPEGTNLDDDWQNYDIIAVASLSYAEELKQNGINAVYVPQFTNPEKFYPAFTEALKTDILFVGSNWHDRTSLRYAIESGFDVAVYGYNWTGVVPVEMYKAPYIANEELNRYYSSAKIVLNDHRPDMKEFGFVNNRIYDATAAGALVISDYMPEIKAMYGEAVPMYQSREELAELLSYYLANDKERQEKAAQARAITLEKFTNVAVAKKILELNEEK
ncbi:MAG: glycosyltransferase [Acetobacter sp.]|nr:glycosyltransferase [Acetobacter sp.]